MTLKLRFEPCFDARKLRRITPWLPDTYGALNVLAPWRKGRWPIHIRCMSEDEIIAGRLRGAGHGYTYEDCDEIWINPTMSWQGYWLVLVHENMHHAHPDATEVEINNVLVPWVYNVVTGNEMSSAWARRHGLGPPCPWRDRGYVY